ncbi:MAG: serine/threonine-protein phosphatase [Oscillospiraceae bacterium]|nr:serine/threonine-protein phosphatase [Oscillospiraceae bacterium]
MYYCCGITDPGVCGEHNEDAFLINKTVMSASSLECTASAPFAAGVADGVGGEQFGEEASRLALELLSGVKVTPNTDYSQKILDIHRYIRKYGASKKHYNMQTTLCALIADVKGGATILNVGDSKLFRYRGGLIKQLSTDQSLVQMLYEKGEITAAQKKNHVHRNVIFPVLGNLETNPKVEVTEIEGGICPGDLILICTDGLADYITRGEFEETLAEPVKLPKRLAALIELAKKGGSKDNITVVGISVI